MRDGLGRLLLLAGLICALLGFGVTPAFAAPPSGAPVNSALPVVKGKAVDGKRVKATTGSWEGSRPFAFGYVWQLCNAAGAECSAITGATSAGYLPRSADVGHT